MLSFNKPIEIFTHTQHCDEILGSCLEPGSAVLVFNNKTPSIMDILYVFVTITLVWKEIKYTPWTYCVNSLQPKAFCIPEIA